VKIAFWRDKEVETVEIRLAKDARSIGNVDRGVKNSK